MTAGFDHLNWVTKILEYLHDVSDEVLSMRNAKQTAFGKWLYENAYYRYVNCEYVTKLIEYNNLLHTRLELLIKLNQGHKDMESMIEFAEILDTSTLLLNELTNLKQLAIQNLGLKNDFFEKKNVEWINNSEDLEVLEEI